MPKNVGWEAKSNHDGSYTVFVNGKGYHCANTYEVLRLLEDTGEKSEYQAKQIYQQALETYGGQLQTFVCMEEMSESGYAGKYVGEAAARASVFVRAFQYAHPVGEVFAEVKQCAYAGGEVRRVRLEFSRF